MRPYNAINNICRSIFFLLFLSTVALQTTFAQLRYRNADEPSLPEKYSLLMLTILPSSTTLALDLECENSGNASALLRFLMFLFGRVLSPLTGMGNTLCTTGMIFIVCCAGAWICTKKAIR